MKNQSWMPSFNELEKASNLPYEERNNFIDKLEINQFDSKTLSRLLVRAARLKNSDFTRQLRAAIQARRDQLTNPRSNQQYSHRTIDRQRLQLDNKKYNLDSQEFAFQREKHQFYKKIQLRKLIIQYIRVIFALIGLLLTACGVYALIFEKPQFSVPAGGQIKQGTVGIKYQGVGGTIIIILACGVIFLTVMFIWFYQQDKT